MAQSEAHMMDVIQIHDETLFGNSRYNKKPILYSIQNANVVDIVDNYSKTGDDALLLLKADKTELIDAYSKSEDDALLLLKADKSELIDSYPKSEDDALLLLKVNVADWTNYVDQTSAQTISGQKLFGIISVSSISKQNQNDAFILFAGGGDMLISSFVTQPQLQEFRDIATGKSKAYVFSTQGEFNDWMAVQDNIAKLVIGDNLYIVDKEVTDYWWDGTDINVLDTQLSDINNVITTLGAVTRGGYAIADISIDGSTLTFAKNTTFVTTGFDQSTAEINNRVMSIADIQSSPYSKSETYAGDVVYTKSEYGALLQQKADKTQLIDSYTKTETNNLLNNKADTRVSYTKSEDGALLLLKAEKTQLIDSYSKNEALLVLKADKTQFINSYIQSETNNQLNKRADREVSYDKSEDDKLLFAKADKTQLIDSYSKGEADNLLKNKANQSTTYTKIETDQLISQVEVGDVDLSGYMTIGTAQTIDANKAFNTACRFISSIDGMPIVTGSSFVKSGADDTIILLGAGGTKPISEFAGEQTDFSNYYAKTQTYSWTKTENKFVRLEGSLQQKITGKLKYVSSFDYQDDTQDYVVNIYLTLSEIDAKLTNVVTTNTTQSITGAKTLNANVSAHGFVKAGKDDFSVLQAREGDRQLSSFGRIEDLPSSAFSVQDDVAVATYIPLPNSTVDQGGYVMITHSTGIQDIVLFMEYKMSNAYIDEALIDAAGLSEFPELYAYIHERETKAIVDGIDNQIIVGAQYLQDQVKDNDDKLKVQPIPQSIVPFKLPQVQIFQIPKSQLAAKVQMYNPADEYFFFYQLRNKVVYNIGLYLGNDFVYFVFTTFLEELWPFSKHALVLGDDVANKQNVMGYISEKGFYLGVSIGSVDQVTSIKGNTRIAIAAVYYTDCEPLKERKQQHKW
ncbi:MAG: hypothetical protein EZS28_020300 [Streblomastix strix]|uniref:Uncharacterized protein n=1 Tax=Streblomastix strix TaxID=222440 RepID=A0A5J4VNT5_9EUKA|nr:MAG: hypothetical protein EZS28_020300 [Streblomastix strix]